MRTRDLHKIFHLEQRETYWKKPFNPDEVDMTEIHVTNLNQQLNRQMIAARFSNLLKASGMDTLPAAFSTSNDTGLIFAFASYVPMSLTSKLEKAINAETRRHGLIPDYAIAVSADEVYQELIRNNSGPHNPGGPDFA